MTTPTTARNAAVLALLALAVAWMAWAADDPGHDLLKRVADAAPKVPFVAKAKLSSPNRGWVRELDLSYKHLNDANASYMEVTAPLDVKDTRFLFFDRTGANDQQFIYLPALKRSIQVSNETRKQPFLGSDFSVSDLTAPDLDAFTHTVVGEENIDGRHCTLVQSVPKTPANELYSKTIVAIDPAELLVMRTQFFDQKGKLLKVWTNEKVEKIDGVWTPRQQRMTNVQDNTQSLLEITEIKYNATVPDETFSKANLIR
jgi:outer membrane lipoprotein-sorting protein